MSDGNDTAESDTEDHKHDSLAHKLEDDHEPQPGPSNVSQPHVSLVSSSFLFKLDR